MVPRSRPRRTGRPSTVVLCAAALLSACGGSGGGGSAALAVRFAPAPPVAEGASGAVTIELVLGAGALDEALSVRVRDTGAGSATAGVDYAAIGDQTVVFPPGSRGGAQLPVQVQVFADDLAEGAEDVVLELTPPVGAALWGMQTVEVVLDDPDVGFVSFATPTTSTANEADATVGLGIRLQLPAGVQLGRDATVLVSDLGAGSATGGSDYDLLLPHTVLFPAGALDGDQSLFDVTVRDDTLFEGDETIVLRLSAPLGSAVLGAQTEHTLTIVEDDVSQTPFLAAAIEFGPVVASGDGVDLGARPATAGPSGGVVLALENLGLDPLTLTAPTLAGAHAGEFVVEVQVGAAPPAGQAAAADANETAAQPFPLVQVDRDARGARAALDAARWAEAEGRQRVRWSGLPHPDLDGLVLALQRLPDPWRADGILLLDGEEIARPAVQLWHGTVEGEAGSDVFLALSAHGSRGWIRRAESGTLLLLSDPEGTGPGGVRLAAPSEIDESSEDSGGLQVCGGALLVPGAPAPPTTPAESSGGGSLVFTECRLALETDYQFHQLFGDANAAAAYATSLIAAVAQTYQRDLQTTLSIAYLGMYSTPDDPWTTQDSFGTSFELLNEFRSAWASGGWPAQADLAHFLSGEVLGGGVAYIGTLCNSAYGFGVSANLSGSIDWGTFDGQPHGLNWDFVVVAHELGHNFGTLHTHEYCPPLDECAPSTYFGSCQAQRSCGSGTIMSYCHLCFGGMNNVETRFHPQIANVLRSSINASCLSRTEVEGLGSARWRLRFDPSGAPGPRAATLWFGHGATNAPTPFQVHLTGTSQ